jgi:hypothetical protein
VSRAQDRRRTGDSLDDRGSFGVSGLAQSSLQREHQRVVHRLHRTEAQALPPHNTRAPSAFTCSQKLRTSVVLPMPASPWTSTATLTTIVAVIACASTASPAFAGETHDNGEGGAGTDSASPYAAPITSLDGMTLAQYIQEHDAADPRTATLI